jgi:hypothetical protein
MKKSKEQYIESELKKLTPSLQSAVYSYVKFAVFHNARICNDGYPDTRFKATFDSKDLRARKAISKIREQYDVASKSGFWNVLKGK